MEIDHLCEEINNGKLDTMPLQSVSNEDDKGKIINTKVDSPNDDGIALFNDGLSKKQRKRLLKKEQWLKVRKLKRIKEKERMRQKKKIAQENNVQLGPSRKKLKCNKMSDSKCKIRVVLDLSFNDLMNDKDIGKCVKQIHHCYSVNRRYSDPMQFYLTSLSGRLEKNMEKHDGFRNWDVHFSSEHFTKLFKLSELVYLTSESDNVITALEEDKVYIIGGLVDHNSQKGLCLKLAKDAGISHGQLPIGKFLQMATRKTLTIDHVFEIMHGVCHGKTWREALLQVIPARKGAQAKDKDSSLDTPEDREVMGEVSGKIGSEENCGSDGTVAPNGEENKHTIPGIGSHQILSGPTNLGTVEDT